MSKVKMKVFRDSVHGYIQIPEIIVSNIIDTKLFQRLHYIEQTSMKTLYPAARHDRFIHSLGVYYLGVQAFDSFKKNVLNKIEDILIECEIDDSWWNKNSLLFSIACLLHDCAHAPFSHTLEFIYDIPNVQDDVEKILISPNNKKEIKTLTKLNYEMLKTYYSEEFEYDYLYGDNIITGFGAPHEKLSAILVSREYKEAINTIFNEILKVDCKSEDLEFIARMIIGCTYNKTNREKSLKNCIISLLNSNSIDVDGLDYIVRDAYNSGMDSWRIDYKRIIDSFTITEISVFEDLHVSNLNLNGIWLKNTTLKNENWKDGYIIGSAGLNNFDENDIDCVSFDGDYEDGHKDSSLFIVNTKLKSKLMIKHGKRKFDTKIKDSCKLSGIYTGIINGSFLGSIFDLNPEQKKEELIIKEEYRLAFNKTCISVLQSAIEARNHEYLWVYSHPRVVYNSEFLQCHLLRLSAKFLCCKKYNDKINLEKIDFNKCEGCSLKKESEEDIILEILGFKSFLDGKDYSTNFEKIGYLFYRSSDDDLTSLFKKIYNENHMRCELASDEIELYFASYFSRKHKRTLWKSFVEYLYYFSLYNGSQIKDVNKLIKKITDPNSAYKTNYGFITGDLKEKLGEYNINDAVCVKWKLKTKELDSYNTFLVFDKASVRLCDILDDSILKNKYEKEFFYIYCDADESIKTKIPNIIDSIYKFI